MARADEGVFGEPTPGAAEHALPPITMPEKLGALLLLACTLVVGLYPRMLTDLILPSSEFAALRGAAEGGVAMSVVSYFDLLRFTLPEIAVMVAGLVALALDLTVLRQSATKMRFGVAALIGCAGCLRRDVRC